MICVTGAGGTLSSEVIRQLEQKAPFRAAYFSDRAAETARARGIDAVVIDYNQPETLRAAFQGCDRLFLLGPNALNQTELELNAVEAAKAAGVRHIVKQSVMGAAEEAYSLANIHRPVEKAIEGSGLAWTFLRPNSFMQNTVTFMAQTIRAEGAFYSASGQARISHVDVRDIAAVAVTALRAPGHEGRIYTLSGPEALTYDDMADELSKALGRDIRHISLPPADLKAGMLAEGMPEAIADRMLDLERYFRENRASRITEDVTTGDRTRAETICRVRAGDSGDGSLERGGCAGRELTSSPICSSSAGLRCPQPCCSPDPSRSRGHVVTSLPFSFRPAFFSGLLSNSSPAADCRNANQHRLLIRGTALVRRRRRRQVPQLVRIAHHVQRPNHVALNLERRSLHRSLGCVHDDTGQAVDGRKAQREVVAPPRTWAFARDVNQEPRRAIGALDHVQRRPHLAAAVRHDAHVAREQLRQCIEIARLGCRRECGHELRMFRIDLARTRRRRGGGPVDM